LELVDYDNKMNRLHNESIPLVQVISEDISMLIQMKDKLEEKGWLVVANTNLNNAIQQYYDLFPDCVMIDIDLTNTGVKQLIENLQIHSDHLFIPKIIISSENDQKTRLSAYEMGFDVFIEKPIDFEELTIRIDRHLERRKLHNRFVLQDDLTNLYNRKFLKEIYKKYINDLSRSQRVFSISILDLDNFKYVNDTFGHLTGDQLLIKFAEFLKENTRSSDIVFRYGGEEFIILFPNTDQSEAVKQTTKLLTEFSDVSFEKNGEYYSVTFSAGVYTITDTNISIDIALKTADQALYQAKDNGRARVETIDHAVVEIIKKPLMISIIDDDEIIRTMLVRILKLMTFEYYELEIMDFEDGVTFFESNRLEIKGEHFLILDGVMPIMDGLEILQKVKRMKKRNIHVLMLTGRKNDSDIERALKLGADDYVTKPFSIKELQARIQRLIQRMK
jgi:two-component system, cell cycle response regulator